MNFVTILMIIIIVAGLLAVVFMFSSVKKKPAKQKDRQTIIKEANRKLAQDPHNPSGLLSLSGLYFSEQLWDKAFPLYEVLLEISSAHNEIDAADIGLKYGICALKMQNPTDAIKGLSVAKSVRPDNFEVNFYLGQAYVLQKDMEKAVPLLKKAVIINPESIDAYKFLGYALYGKKSYRDSLPYLKKAFDNNPDDKELLFTMASCMYEVGSGDRALKIFLHLRPDPEFGAKSSLLAGIIQYNLNQVDKAIQDFEIGLKHQEIEQDTMLDLKYRLAQAYLKLQDISNALLHLKDIQNIAPNYKDVVSLISRYQELNQNKNLQTYLIANNSDFVALCRKIVVSFYPKSKVRILDVAVTAECTDVLTEVDTIKWQDNVVFRFYRTTGSTGELYIRDFHGKIRDSKAGQGICFTAGVFTEEARKYIDGRPIDLIDKAQLIKLLNSVDMIPNVKF